MHIVLLSVCTTFEFVVDHGVNGVEQLKAIVHQLHVVLLPLAAFEGVVLFHKARLERIGRASAMGAPRCAV